jgi:hypothetical protein
MFLWELGAGGDAALGDPTLLTHRRGVGQNRSLADHFDGTADLCLGARIQPTNSTSFCHSASLPGAASKTSRTHAARESG